jgi:hypothetical protein
MPRADLIEVGKEATGEDADRLRATHEALASFAPPVENSQPNFRACTLELA